MKDSLKHLSLGVLYAYIVTLLFLLFKDFEIATVYKSLFFFVLCAVAPFLAIGKAGYTIPAILFCVLVCYSIYAKFNGRLQSIAFAIFFVGWEIYGVRCLVLVSGGA